MTQHGDDRSAAGDASSKRRLRSQELEKGCCWSRMQEGKERLCNFKGGARSMQIFVQRPGVISPEDKGPTGSG